MEQTRDIYAKFIGAESQRRDSIFTHSTSEGIGAMAALAKYVYFFVIGKSSLSLTQSGICVTAASSLSLDYKYSIDTISSPAKAVLIDVFKVKNTVKICKERRAEGRYLNFNTQAKGLLNVLPLVMSDEPKIECSNSSMIS